MYCFNDTKNKVLQMELRATYVLASIYKRSLLAEGFPTSTHIYDLDFSYCDIKHPSNHLKCLMNIKDYYFSLDKLHRKIFVNEVLEEGEHYNFWWMKFVSDEREYKQHCLKLLKKINNSFEIFSA